jgi:diadenosine tetraphosphate (Ap4A) HIT family hydrolase
MTVLATECRYCTATPAALEDVMFHICDLATSRVFLYRDQTYKGRCVLLLKKHVRELFELDATELAAFTQELARVAQAISQTVPCDKVNYALYGDKADHLHAHIVPKTQQGPAWGQPFILNTETPVELALAERQELIQALSDQLG